MKKINTNYSFIAVVSLFFLWALAHNLNPILIPHLKRACQLSDMQSALVDAAFYIAYFLFALPAGFVIQRYGYQKTIVSGLFLFAMGALLFYPAAAQLSYPFFLLALFIVAAGLTFLETAANPYVGILGPPETATQRLNFAQAFNGLGGTLAAMIGGKFILSNATRTSIITRETLLEEASFVQMPYVCIALLVLLVMFIFMRIPLPDIRNNETSAKFSFKSLWANLILRKALIAQFFYVGAQVGAGSFFIRYVTNQTNASQQEAAYYLSSALFLFMLGRFVGSYLMRFIQPKKLLFIYACINIFLMAIVIAALGTISLIAYMLVFFFMSIMFPSIFSLGIQTLGNNARFGSSLMVMTIVGGAFLPLIMGYISDHSAIQFAYIVPLSCFAIIGKFASGK